jgi:hypothetical protein
LIANEFNMYHLSWSFNKKYYDEIKAF